MTKEEAKKLLHGIMERNGSYPVYANNVKQAIEALSEPDGSSEIPNDLEEAAKAYADDINSNECLYTYTDFTDAFKAGAKWQKEQMISALKNDGDLPIEFIDKFHEIDRTAFQNGQKNMKEQMMKEAVEGIAVINANAKEDGFGYVRSDYVSDDVLRGLGNFKLIIVKEEGK